MSAPAVELEWSERAAVPPDGSMTVPTPGTKEFLARVRGRAGDLVVVQFKSFNGLTDEQIGALQTLGLKGIDSMSLRRNDDVSTWGSIEKVRDFVGVIDLGGLYYKSQQDRNAVEYEYTEYGSSTRPGALVRDERGQYFAFESDRHNLLVMWNSDYGIDEVLGFFAKHFETPGLETPESGTVGFSVELGKTPETVEAFHSGGTTVVDGPTDEVRRMIEAHSSAVSFARLAFRGVELTWQEPHRRFEDREVEYAEIGLYAADLDLTAAKAFALDTGTDVIADATLAVRIRQHGNPKTLMF